IIEQRIPMTLVLEDDVILPPDMPVLLDALEKVVDPARPEVILLSPAQFGRSIKRPPVAGRCLREFVSGYYTSSYVLTLPAAKALEKELFPIHDVADCWKRLRRYRVVDLYGLDPFAVGQAQETFGSGTMADLGTVLKPGGLGAAVKLRRGIAEGCDIVYGWCRRHFRPYAGIDI
ncbi:MAG TPA: hypothetical protein PKI32_09740, partial [Opitutales bacterium]|nr:hypothetical protein [Opitutales bacterium]